MKRKEFQTFKNKPIAEIDKALHDLEERLVNLKMDLALGKVKNIREIKDIKKSIAQLLTIKRLK